MTDDQCFFVPDNLGESPCLAFEVVGECLGEGDFIVFVSPDIEVCGCEWVGGVQ